MRSSAVTLRRSALAGLLLLPSLALAGERVSYTVAGQAYEGYYAAPARGAPLVLLVHDWDGLTDYEIKRVGMLVELGYAVFAADLFGAGVRPTTLDDKRQHTGELYRDRKKMRALLQAALDAAQQQGADVGRAVAMGYCFGGAAVLELARSGAALKGFASFHGGLGRPTDQNYAQVKAPILVMHGSADRNISMQDFATLATELEQAGVAHEMITYSGAPHAFTVFGGAAYTESADQASWSRFTQFLQQRLR